MLLALETATDVCGVALAREGRVIAELSLRRPRAHAENVLPLAREALRAGGVETAALEAVAVSMGPGSYTGLRIGVSTAKGLAEAAGAALVGVPTLEALAARVAPQADTGDLICAALDARRDEVYAAAFRVTGGSHMDGNASNGDALEAAVETAVLPVEELPDWLGASTGRLWLTGGGAQKAAPAFRASGRWNVRLLSLEACAPSAAWVARRAHLRLQQDHTEDLAAFEPFYLKDVVARTPQRSALEKLSF